MCIGIKIQVEVLLWVFYFLCVNKNEFVVLVLVWGNGIGEVSYVLVNVLGMVDFKKGIGVFNWNYYSSLVVDKVLVDLIVEFDVVKCEVILCGVVKIVLDEVGVILLYYYQNIWVVKKGLKVIFISSDCIIVMMVIQDKK